MSMLLKLRLQSLATLSRQMHTTERKALSRVQLMRIETRLRNNGIPLRQMARIMKRAGKQTVKRIRENSIRSDGHIQVPGPDVNPEWIQETEKARSTMHTLRTAYLRRELRAGYLAYAFLRDIPFDTVEWQAYEPVPIGRVEELIGEYTPADEKQVVAQRFAEWIARVQVSIDEGRHPRATESESRREWRREREQEMRAW